MLVLLNRLLRHLTRRTWTLPAMVALAVFATSWPLMHLAEPAESNLTDPANYWWYFLVTTSTVGYGDHYPVSTPGRLVGVYIITGGIAALTTLFARLTLAIDTAKGRRMHGSVTLDHSGHIVILGHHPGRTERILDEILADGDRPVVLCSWNETETHPVPDKPVDFVRGDLTDEAVLRRAGIHRAHSVLIDARDDNEALAVLVTVDHVAGGAHLVVALRDMDRAAHLGYVNDTVHCVQWHHPRMLTEELQDPGISQVYAELMTHGGDNTYSIALPEPLDGVSFGDCQTALGRRHEATLLAVSHGEHLSVSPPWNRRLEAGTVLYYIGKRRLTAAELVQTVHSR